MEPINRATVMVSARLSLDVKLVETRSHTTVATVLVGTGLRPPRVFTTVTVYPTQTVALVTVLATPVGQEHTLMKTNVNHAM